MAHKNSGWTVLIEKKRMVVDTYEYPILELKTPTKSGATHAIIDPGSKETLMLFARDLEGEWLVVSRIITGDIKMFYLR